MKSKQQCKSMHTCYSYANVGYVIVSCSSLIDSQLSSWS